MRRNVESDDHMGKELKWTSMSSAYYNGILFDHFDHRLLQFTEDFSFTQRIKSPTRPASGKTLDLSFSSYPNVVSNINLVSGMSDHLAVLFNINIKATKSPEPPHRVYVYKRAK